MILVSKVVAYHMHIDFQKRFSDIVCIYFCAKYIFKNKITKGTYLYFMRRWNITSCCRLLQRQENYILDQLKNHQIQSCLNAVNPINYHLSGAVILLLGKNEYAEIKAMILVMVLIIIRIMTITMLGMVMMMMMIIGVTQFLSRIFEILQYLICCFGNNRIYLHNHNLQI